MIELPTIAHYNIVQMMYMKLGDTYENAFFTREDFEDALGGPNDVDTCIEYFVDNGLIEEVRTSIGQEYMLTESGKDLVRLLRETPASEVKQ